MFDGETGHTPRAGLTVATMLAMSRTYLRGRLIQAQRAEAEADGTEARASYERRLLTKLSAMELPSPPSSGITIQAHR